jgi:hypothetical protein
MNDTSSAPSYYSHLEKGLDGHIHTTKVDDVTVANIG